MDDDKDFISIDPAIDEKREKGVYDIQTTIEGRYTSPESNDYIVYRELSDIEWSEETYRILDVGSSTGIALSDLVERLEKETPAEFQAYALDVDPESLKKSRERDITPILAKSQNLPFEDNAFDVIVSANLLLLQEDIDATIEEIDRVMDTSEGKVVLGQGYENQNYQGLHHGNIDTV